MITSVATSSSPSPNPITITSEGCDFVLRCELWLPRPINEVFPFFSDAYNLDAITPPWLNFHILTPRPIPMQQDCLIEYKLSLHGLPIRWRTRITVWQPPHRFVDQQERGPYQLWHHEHTFTPEIRDHIEGTLCRDIVHHRALGGSLVHKFFVRRDVQRIFAYRQTRLMELFPAPTLTPESRPGIGLPN